MKFAIIKERKSPPDRRVVFSPKTLLRVKQQFPEAKFKVEKSKIRIFPDEVYKLTGFSVVKDISDCDVMIGVKEVPVEALIPNKSYFFFSHTIKKQPYNRKLLQAILNKNITLYDHETIIDAKNNRLIGFGRYAGIVGAYNAFRTWGLKFDSWNLPKANTLSSQKLLNVQLDKIKVPNIKILLTGGGKVSKGAIEILKALKIPSVSIEDYLTKSFSTAVYCNIDSLDFNARIDGKTKPLKDFFKNPSAYKSTFMRFVKETDMLITGHFFGDGSPFLFTREEAKSDDFNIKVVADISCDIDGPVATTIRASTIEDPIYGYNPQTESEVDFKSKDAIAVMAVDNLPCELPNDASVGFGEMFLKHVIPAFFNDDADGVLERARMTQNGKLTPRFAYLQDYVDGKE
ncbi:lysine ketoglutarate reductase (LKR) / saccharopine dehydrogenase [Formosa agariphila KMM 3901]|uniref:Saccharopine dehydrogenase [NAD(+), L-lysine-forming] n=1 Tax=Formosa agariphila (strain DSM 15362 / KCTC 12365 / LMG 23005 / KMM 3901 / M-2Alg 35-1) TaxID=1347342 RepID=T2KQI8_FORAG|nr:NAD(P)-dependent oxidoreductase [Formosa agariphila]CDF80249.1 lysine ketoglutarate reductase (LKR) / saccharopine dehydrogenase [Formosa agariphila KMM 3901]